MSTRKERKERSPAQRMNAQQAGFMPNQARDSMGTMESMYVRMLTELSLNRFKWTGLPKSVDERYLELTLFRDAIAIFYMEQRVGQFLAVAGSGSGHQNHYRNPTQFTTAENGLTRQLSWKDAVPIYSNYQRLPDHDIVYLYARKLAHIDRTMEINVESMRQTQMVFVEEEQRLSYANLMRQYTEGQPIIYGTRNMDPGKITTMQLGVDKDQVKTLQTVKAAWWNEAMTLLGINNTNQEKKERMISGEADGNKDQVTAVRSVSLKARQQACVQINNRWPNLNISVDWDETANQSTMIMGMASPDDVEA